jgi:head-tail adaptor
MRNLDKIGTIKQRTETNTNGSVTSSWATVVNYPFALDSSNGAEQKNADKIEGVQTLIVTGRYYAGITSEMKMVIDSIDWNIEGIAEMGRKERLILTLRKND